MSTNEQRYHLNLNRLAQTIVTRERFAHCPDGNPDCEHHDQPRGYGYHSMCFAYAQPPQGNSPDARAQRKIARAYERSATREPEQQEQKLTLNQKIRHALTLWFYAMGEAAHKRGNIF